MKKKGFTLIELLAVIVILAVIALIATPTILGVIEKARIGALKSSASGYIDAVEKQVAMNMMNTNKLQISDGTYGVEDLIVSYKGEGPEKGTIIINKGIVKKSLLKMEDYYTCYSNNKVEVDKDITKLTSCSNLITNNEIVYAERPILEKAQKLVYDKNGVCKTDGTTYNYMGGCYIKGTSNNNYVWYNGFMWRIMGINADQTVRLITDENVTALAYGATGTALTYTENEGYIHDWLNEYFYEHLNNTKSIIQEGTYFCSESTNEQTLTEGRTACTIGSEITTKIGLISIDEYLLAGTTSSYLNIGQASRTMTPYSATYAWTVSINGNANNVAVANADGVRPVINVSSDTPITSGDGAAQNFYILEENKNTNITGTISEVATSGEYVNLEGHTYRVIKKETNSDNEIIGIKVILDNFYKETENTIYTMSFGSNNTFSLESGVGAKLNGIEGDNGKNVITWLGLTNSDKIVETAYYQGDGFDVGTNYQNTLKESNGIIAKVGLIQVGDMLASQSSTMLTNNYTTASDYNNTKRYWTMNKYTNATNAWRMDNDGDVFMYAVTKVYAIRPVITVRNDLNITDGNGTWKNPYEI